MSRDERADLAEELYGHLWQRWQDAVTAGESPDAAEDRAIAAFGGPASLGREITGAYHSRLYASTIGALLPGMVSTVGECPPQATLLQLLLAGVAVQNGVVAAWAIQTLTPGRFLATALSLALSTVAILLAIRAIGRAQGWALRLARTAIGLALVEGAVSLLNGPGLNVSLLGAIALLATLPALGPEVEGWVAASRPIRRRLGIPMAAMLVAGFVVPAGATQLPDPTQVGPSDLSLTATATCNLASDGTTAVTLVARFSWTRLDPWPNGLLRLPHFSSSDRYTIQPGQAAYDGVDAGIIERPSYTAAQYAGVTLDPATHGGYSAWWLGPAEPDASGGLDWGWGSTYWAGLSGATGANVWPGSLQPGKTYAVTWKTVAPSPVDPADHPIFVVSYAHLDHFLVQAVATCDRPGIGEPVAPLVTTQVWP